MGDNEILTKHSVWGVADGARKVGVDGEIIAYAVLDVLAKPVFGIWLLITHANLPETNVELGGFWAHGLNSEGALRIGDSDGA
jgi:bacteriorhodopsin